MPLQNDQYDAIMREYSRRQAANRRLLEERRKNAYEKAPRLLEIDQEVAALSAEKARALILGRESGVRDLKDAISLLGQERQALLAASAFPADYLELPCTCPLCQDTGYIGNQKCACFRRAEIECLYSGSHLREILEKENFDHFSFDYYSDTMTDEATGSTARELARRAYDAARSFVRDFDRSFENLYFYGNTGVGKTFLSHCIARELLDASRGVLYFSAFDFFDMLASAAFSGEKKGGTNDLIFDCDLLIIDDLGTELTNSFVSSQLFLCVNERLMRRKSTIISTNLDTAEILPLYSERTFSRIFSSYRVLKMIGPDIRIERLRRQHPQGT